MVRDQCRCRGQRIRLIQHNEMLRIRTTVGLLAAASADRGGGTEAKSGDSPSRNAGGAHIQVGA